jgi:hypothetical protein
VDTLDLQWDRLIAWTYSTAMERGRHLRQTSLSFDPHSREVPLKAPDTLHHSASMGSERQPHLRSSSTASQVWVVMSVENGVVTRQR